MCINAGAEEAVANKWLREFQRRNLVVHFDRSKNAELKNAIILRPNVNIFFLQLTNYSITLDDFFNRVQKVF
jgi:hypothetical protein